MGRFGAPQIPPLSPVSVFQFLFNLNVCFVIIFFSVPSNHEEEQHKSIFSRCDNRQGFQLKENVQFHLYISTSPCGDARIFSPHEAGVEGERQLRGERRGALRRYTPQPPL